MARAEVPTTRGNEAPGGTERGAEAMSTTINATQSPRVGPALRRLRRNVERDQPRVDFRAPRFASVTESGAVELEELIDLTDLF